jgi:DNA polymerase-4
VSDIARLEETALVSMLGRGAGRHLHALAHNRDPRRVERGRRRGTIGSQRARRLRSPEEIEAVLHGIVDRVMRRMRKADRVGRTVVLRLRFDDFTRATRSHTLSRPTDETWVVLVTARWLLATALPLIERRGLTLVGLTVADLENADAVQLRLPFEAHSSALDAALDLVRERFGSKAITRAVLLGRDEGLSPPLLPD